MAQSPVYLSYHFQLQCRSASSKTFSHQSTNKEIKILLSRDDSNRLNFLFKIKRRDFLSARTALFREAFRAFYMRIVKYFRSTTSKHLPTVCLFNLAFRALFTRIPHHVCVELYLKVFPLNWFLGIMRLAGGSCVNKRSFMHCFFHGIRGARSHTPTTTRKRKVPVCWLGLGNGKGTCWWNARLRFVEKRKRNAVLDRSAIEVELCRCARLGFQTTILLARVRTMFAPRCVLE